MLWMESYLFYYTVRLGVIVLGTFSFFQLLVPSLLLFIYGIPLIDPIIHLFENDAAYKQNVVIKRVIDWLNNDPQTAMAMLQTYIFTHMFACVLLVFGAYKLNKWCLVPFAILELFRVVYMLAGHIVLMIMLKKILNLGVLIAYTLFGGFLILYLGYNWAASVALFQIISLINSERYQRLYGTDPMRPIVKQYSGSGERLPYGLVRSVRVLTTPNSGDIDEQKYQNSLKPSGVGIISVIPVAENGGSARQPLILHTRAKPSQAETQPRMPVGPDYYNNEYYGHWHWAELPGANQQRQLTLRSNFISRY